MSDCSTSAFKVPEKPKLKNCPFCDGEVEIDNPMPNYQSGHGFHCLKCGAYFQLGDSDEEAAEAWSTRYQPTCQIEKITDGLTPDWWHCLACDGYIPAPDEISFCPYCGARVEVVD